MLPPEPDTSDPRSTTLERTLSGALPCSRCGYLLEGLSVRDVCPECGLPITTTILAAVDPYAEELQPLTRPRAAAAAIIVWSAAALGASLWIWAARAADAIGAATGAHFWTPSPIVLLALAAASGVGSVVFMRPAASWPRRTMLLAALGALGYIPILLVLWAIHVEMDFGRAAPYFGPAIDTDRHGLRLLQGGLMAGILLCLRPAARQLVARSLRLRQGRVDRQTILAMLACIGVAAAGDLAMLAAHVSGGLVGDLLRVAGLALIGTGSLLITLGLAGMVIDAVRIARAVLSPAPSLRRVLVDNPLDTGPRKAATNG